jgi:hypothetical protein
VRAHGAHTRHHASCGVHCVMCRTHGIMWRTHCIVHHVSYTASCVWRTYGIMHHVAWRAGGATLAVVVTQFPPRYACPQRRQAALMKMQSDNQAFPCDSAAPRSTAGAREPRATNGPAAWELKLYPCESPCCRGLTADHGCGTTDAWMTLGKLVELPSSAAHRAQLAKAGISSTDLQRAGILR